MVDFDAAVDDQLGGPHVNVVSPAAVEVFHKETRVVWARVQGEAGSLEPLKEGGIAAGGFFGGFDVESFAQWVGVGHVEKIGVFDWGLEMGQERE